MKTLLLPVLFACLFLASAAAAAQPTPPLSSIRVSGTAVVTTKPDRVRIDLGVVTQGREAELAATENATQLKAVLAAIRKAAGEGADIKTVNYALAPNYRYPSTGGEPVITGYTATNIVRIALDDLDRMGTVIDTATRLGANRAQDIQFTLRDPEAVHLQALREAAARAKAAAETLASALGLKILRVLSVEEVGTYQPPIRPLRMAVARTEVAPGASPIEAGTLDVRAEVTLTVEVGS